MTNSSFWLYLQTIKGKIFCPFQDFEGPLVTQIQGLSARVWDFLLPISGLSRIFKDRGNPDYLYVVGIYSFQPSH